MNVTPAIIRAKQVRNRYQEVVESTKALDQSQSDMNRDRNHVELLAAKQPESFMSSVSRFFMGEQPALLTGSAVLGAMGPDHLSMAVSEGLSVTETFRAELKENGVRELEYTDKKLPGMFETVTKLRMDFSGNLLQLEEYDVAMGHKTESEVVRFPLGTK